MPQEDLERIELDNEVNALIPHCLCERADHPITIRFENGRDGRVLFLAKRLAPQIRAIRC